MQTHLQNSGVCDTCAHAQRESRCLGHVHADIYLCALAENPALVGMHVHMCRENLGTDTFAHA